MYLLAHLGVATDEKVAFLVLQKPFESIFDLHHLVLNVLFVSFSTEGQMQIGDDASFISKL